MRTTFTPEPDIADRLSAIARETGESLNKVVNKLLRVALKGDTVREVRKPYRIPVFDLKLQPGVDPERLSELVDELEDEERWSSRT